jgi:hypothetical protein
MFDAALAGKLPIIGVTTDDLVNYREVLTTYLNGKRRVVDFNPKNKGLVDALYVTEEEDVATADVYRDFEKSGLTLVVINPTKNNPMVFDAGILTPPESMVRMAISDTIDGDHANEFYPVLKGLSLKTVKEVILLTNGRAGFVSGPELRKTRSMLFGSTQGLTLEDTTYDFYVWPKELEDWLTLNTDYFSSPKVHAKLVPRGVLFKGSPGVGKSMGAKAIANKLDVPLYRFDIASTLDKYIGVSESRVSKILSMVDRESPCVLLLDEIEKIFQQKDESGVIQRMLSQLLWWLNEHQSRVFVVMTSNDISSVPPELYRPGRIDRIFEIQKLNFFNGEVSAFASKVFESVIGKKPTQHQVKVIRESLQSIAGPPGTPISAIRIAHGDVAEEVFTAIKRHKWAT